MSDYLGKALLKFMIDKHKSQYADFEGENKNSKLRKKLILKGYNECEQIIEQIPTADVAEVKWIDVNERLPEKNVRVLVYLKENVCDYTRIDTDRRIDNGQWIRWGNNVTHWQPLPEPPSGAKMDGGKEE